MLHQYNDDLLPKEFGIIGKTWTILLLIIFLTGIYCYTNQLREGLAITGMRDFVFWGIYISNFVFFVAISLVGSLMTAVLYLMNISWRAPLTRIAEIIAVAAIIFAGLIIIVDMGRPDRVVNMFLHGRIQSPIIWDVMVVSTYMTLSILLLYFPLLPGISFCRDRLTDIPNWQRRMYTILSLGWNNSPEQYRIVKRAVTILSVMIIPVALCIHTVTSWLFASTYRPGWDSTNFGAYFVSGAFLVGCGGVAAGMYLLRRFYSSYEKYLTDDHFDKVGKLLVLLAVVYAYFSINEYLIPAYKMKGEEGHHLTELFTGYYAPMFWSVQFFGMILPIAILLFKKGRKPLPMFVMAVLVIVCAWFKRYLIVIPSMSFMPLQELPEEWKHYTPTFPEWAITCGSLAGALLIITFFVRFFPIISVWEIAEERGIPSGTIFKHLNKNNEK
ncbi:MAG: polysulfide reductase NrfD [Bacteroidetes bacterium]|nr:polysulfide reductase NrfD [Bacteroidota bacterium]